MPRTVIVRRLIAVALWLAPLVWFGWRHAWVSLAIATPFTAAVVTLAVWSTRRSCPAPESSQS
jgi:hypothetical protein